MNSEDLKIEKEILINQSDALLIVDIQNDFIPGGALPVEGGDLIIEAINEISKRFHDNKAAIILTQDWHPVGHLSFASAHPGKNPMDEFQTEDGAIGPVLWPDHCVQGSKGASFHKDLKVDFASAIIRKGINPKIDSYSAFLENDKKSETGLAGFLKSLKIERLFVCGLALDYCCFFSAIDGVAFGFKVYLLVDLTKGIDVPAGNISNSLEIMRNKGVTFAQKESFN